MRLGAPSERGRSRLPHVKTNHTLRTDVQAWLSDRDQVMERYGHISRWDTTGVTDMSGLFFNQSETIRTDTGTRAT